MSLRNLMLYCVVSICLFYAGCGINDPFGRPFSKPPVPAPISHAVIYTDSVTDIDGNLYRAVTIGSKVWLTENLKTTRYNDGTPIPQVTDSAAWIALTTPGYCWYNNDTAYKNIYGALYNWSTVVTGKLAPAGWHVATDNEWGNLAYHLGGEANAGGKLKEIDTTHWASPNTGATNQVGFSALPGGSRSSGGPFFNLGTRGTWWTTTPFNTDSLRAWARLIYSDGTGAGSINWPVGWGYSVRCVRN